MKKIVFLIFAASVFFPCRMSSQTMDHAVEAYHQFMDLLNSSTDEEVLFKSLDECYRSCAILAESVKPNSEEEMTLRTQLRTIRPYMVNGAAYYQRTSPSKSLAFAKAYMDIPMMEIFDGIDFARDAQYVQMSYFAASGSYNSGDYRSAVKYFQEYLTTNDKNHRRDVYLYMAQACEKIEDYSLVQKTLDKAILEYPNDYDLLAKAINNSIDNGDNTALQSYLERALNIRPNDKALLGIQGQSFERAGDYAKAMTVYSKLNQVQPNNLNVYKHLAANCYNMGVQYYNNSLLTSGESSSSRYLSQSKDYFKEAIPLLQNVLDNDSSLTEFWEAMAVACNYTGNESGFGSANNRLVAMGEGRVSKNIVPELISFDGRRSVEPNPSVAVNRDEVPAFSEFARDYISAAIAKWQTKDPYETVKEFQDRVNVASRDRKVKELTKDAKDSYLQTYSVSLRASDFDLKPYDAENEVFLASSRFGEVIIPVPRANNEARTFEINWNGTQLTDVRYCIDGDRLALKSIVFKTPIGKSYKYDNSEAMDYTIAEVDMDLGEIDYSSLASSGNDGIKKVNKNKVSIGSSDVDIDIPENRFGNPKTFAFIIANEKYQQVAPVSMAVNDGRTLAEYCRKTLGCPKENVRVYENATYGNMLGAVREMKAISDAFQGDIKFIFYYAGHGIPDDATKDAFLLPVDADGMSTEVCYPLSRLYRELGDLNAKCVTVFLDACFSGVSRSGDPLTAARGVSVRPKPVMAQGNMVVFTAVSGDQTAFPYDDKGHGLFTYFLLKKLQETAGDVTLDELGSYISEQVGQKSVVINHKSQTPVITPSFSMEKVWKKIKLSE